MWVVTREAAEGQPLVDALKKRGHEAVCVPAIRREPLPWPARLAPSPNALVFLTSPYAARCTLEHLKHVDTDGRLGMRFAALAPSTIAALTSSRAHVEVAAEGGA